MQERIPSEIRIRDIKPDIFLRLTDFAEKKGLSRNQAAQLLLENALYAETLHRFEDEHNSILNDLINLISAQNMRLVQLQLDIDQILKGVTAADD